MRSPDRRTLRLALVAAFVALAGCVSHVRGETQPEFDACLARLQPAAQKAGVQPASFERFTVSSITPSFRLLLYCS
jgi:hypothetical protein